MKRQVEPPGPPPPAPLSSGLIAEGRFLYVSGQVPLRDGRLIGGSIEEQTAQVLDNLGAVLKAASATYADVVRCQVFLADFVDFAGMNRVYETYFPDPRPTRTTVGVALYGGCAVEIDCVAVLPAEPEA